MEGDTNVKKGKCYRKYLSLQKLKKRDAKENKKLQKNKRATPMLKDEKTHEKSYARLST